MRLKKSYLTDFFLDFAVITATEVEGTEDALAVWGLEAGTAKGGKAEGLRGRAFIFNWQSGKRC